MLPHLRATLLADTKALRAELEGYADEAYLWKTVPGLANPAGNLALHLAGNLQHFIGAVLGGSGYVRDREAEFTRRGVPRAEILREIDTALAVVFRTLEDLPPARWDEEYPLAIDGTRVTTGFFLVRLCRHLAYHLGQINYHRRILGG
jgi:hypothetical protein